MKIELNQEKIELLFQNSGYREWKERIKCWIGKSEKYCIHIFQIIVNDELELSKWYEEINADIALEVQSTLETKIEKWNIYLIFECEKSISLQLKNIIEQDKYSTRKMVWDSLDTNQIQSQQYLVNRLFELNIRKEDINTDKVEERESLQEYIKRTNIDLYEALIKGKGNIETGTALYIGGNANGKEN